MSILNQLTQHKFKLLCFVITLIFISIFYLNFKTRKKISTQNHEISDFANHLLSYTDSLERKNKILESSFLSLSQDLQNHNNLKEKICNSIVDDAVDPYEIAKGYDCLAQIELGHKDIASTYRAIRYESLALTASYNEEYQYNMIKIITGEAPMEPIVSFDENLFLMKLSKSANQEIASRALYRISLINSIGRASSKEALHYDLSKAAALRKQVLSLVKFPKRKSIDVLFSLNDNPKYIKYAKTAMGSVLLNADLDSDYNFYVIMDAKEQISTENQAQLNSLHDLSSYIIKFITLPQNILDYKKADFSNPRVRILLQKLLVEGLLPELDRIVTLDVDLIVLRDLYPLQKQDFNNKILVAEVENIDLNRKKLCDFNYMSANTGVNIQNLQLMREINNSNYLVDQYLKIFASKHKGCLRLVDQDVLNIAYKDQIKFISKRWNYLPVFDYNTKFMPYIIHFGGTKPSEEVKNQENLLYFKYDKLANGSLKSSL